MIFNSFRHMMQHIVPNIVVPYLKANSKICDSVDESERISNVHRKKRTLYIRALLLGKSPKTPFVTLLATLIFAYSYNFPSLLVT